MPATARQRKPGAGPALPTRAASQLAPQPGRRRRQADQGPEERIQERGADGVQLANEPRREGDLPVRHREGLAHALPLQQALGGEEAGTRGGLHGAGEVRPRPATRKVEALHGGGLVGPELLRAGDRPVDRHGHAVHDAVEDGGLPDAGEVLPHLLERALDDLLVREGAQAPGVDDVGTHEGRAVPPARAAGVHPGVDLGEVVELAVQVVPVVGPRPHLLAPGNLAVEPHVDRQVLAGLKLLQIPDGLVRLHPIRREEGQQRLGGQGADNAQARAELAAVVQPHPGARPLPSEAQDLGARQDARAQSRQDVLGWRQQLAEATISEPHLHGRAPHEPAEEAHQGSRRDLLDGHVQNGMREEGPEVLDVRLPDPQAPQKRCPGLVVEGHDLLLGEAQAVDCSRHRRMLVGHADKGVADRGKPPAGRGREGQGADVMLLLPSNPRKEVAPGLPHEPVARPKLLQEVEEVWVLRDHDVGTDVDWVPGDAVHPASCSPTDDGPAFHHRHL
mmetsp:Transcript_53258/g.158819  ORF Transcript_53258/g.158819 Transcript_53258/m.158819 type:complete len:505 (+) Transcript_53258:67-1581(+)